MYLAPIVLFVYNRLDHTKQTLESLLKNEYADKSEIFIFCDGAKNKESAQKVNEVRNYVKSIKGFKNINIIERIENLGLAKSIITGTTEIINKFGKIIVLEDDLIKLPGFLKFMNNALDFYENNKKIFSIGGYNYPFKFPKHYKDNVYISYRTESWGWATWKDRWEKADWEVKDFEYFIKNKSLQRKFNRGGTDLTPFLKWQMEGKMDSWAIRWDYTHFKNDCYCLRPVISKIDNIGFDGSGVHCGTKMNDKFSVASGSIDENEITFVKDIKIDKKIMASFRKFVSPKKEKITIKRIISYVKRRILKINTTN